MACGSANSDALFNSAPPGTGATTDDTGGHTSFNGTGGATQSGGSGKGGTSVANGGATISSGGSVIGNGGRDGSGGFVSMSGGDTGAGGVFVSGGATGAGGITGAGGALPTCSDRVKNQDETDVDCGGSVCPACIAGKLCLLARDCSTSVCGLTAFGVGFCRVASCGDKIQNGTETDIDCGGSACAGCASGKKCSVKADCAFGTCESGICSCTPLKCDQLPGACGAGISNGCGGTMTCQACSLLCMDTMKDGNETAVDCGGPDCKPCAAGMTCALPRDCDSHVCKAATSGATPSCRTPTCTDGVKNGTETDVDCGGSCPKCATGKSCGTAMDCASTVCTNGLCACKPLTCASYPTSCGSLSDGCNGTLTCPCKPLCTDMKSDGRETDVDCGGPDCPPCDMGQACKVNGDCAMMLMCSSSGGSGMTCQ